MSFIEDVVANNHIYRVISDVDTAYQVLVQGCVLDEITQKPPLVPVDVRIARDDVLVKVIPGGCYCLAGRADLVFPDPATVYNVVLDISAIGYGNTVLTVNVPVAPTFPISAPPVLLRSPSVRIQGRMMDDGANRTPLVGAHLTIVGFSPSAVGEHIIALSTPLHYPHNPGVGVEVHERTLTPTGAARTLAAVAPAGSETVTLSTRSGLAGNPVLRFAQPGASWLEYYQVASVSTAPANLALPGEVTLRTPLNHTFPSGTTVEPVTLGMTTATAHLTRSGQTGEGKMIIDVALTGATVEVVDAATEPEYHMVGVFSDSAGFYRIEGIGGMRSVRLQAEAALHKSVTLDWLIDYGQSVNIVDFLLPKAP